MRRRSRWRAAAAAKSSVHSRDPAGSRASRRSKGNSLGFAGASAMAASMPSLTEASGSAVPSIKDATDACSSTSVDASRIAVRTAAYPRARQPTSFASDVGSSCSCRASARAAATRTASRGSSSSFRASSNQSERDDSPNISSACTRTPRVVMQEDQGGDEPSPVSSCESRHRALCLERILAGQPLHQQLSRLEVDGRPTARPVERPVRDRALAASEGRAAAWSRPSLARSPPGPRRSRPVVAVRPCSCPRGPGGPRPSASAPCDRGRRR